MGNLIGGVFDSPPRSTTIIHIGDLQLMSRLYPHNYTLLQNAVIRINPALVVFTGDTGELSSVAEWTAFKGFYDAVIGAGIKFAFAMGNHDYTFLDETRATPANGYLATQAWLTQREAGHIENTYGLITLGERQWLIVVLEYGSRDAVLTWADGILKTYPNTPAIVVRHDYLYYDGSRYDWATKGVAQNWNPNNTTYQEWVVPPYHAYTPLEGVNDGQKLWDGLIDVNPNVRFVLCGHAGGPAVRLRSTRGDGSIVDQMMRDFSILPNGGGWLSLYRLDYANNQLAVNTYGPIAGANMVSPTTACYVDRLF
jgi:hypothetical protein